MFWKNTEERLTKKLHAAMAKADMAVIVKLIASGANPALNIQSTKRQYEGNALHAHASVYHDNYPEQDRAAVRYILSRGVDISAGNSKGETPLHLAMRTNDKNTYIDDCINFLIDNRANVKAKTHDGQTPMHYLVSALETDVRWQKYPLKRLISHGADVNAQDNLGITPLMLAATMGAYDVCEILIEEGADIHLTDHTDKTASYYAEIAENFTLAAYLKEKEKSTRRKVAAPAVVVEPVAVSVAPPMPEVLAPQETGWSKQGTHKISCVTVERALGYKITEIFNFQARTYVCLSQNMKTSAEALVHKTFDDFADKGVLLTALEQLRLQGGVVDVADLNSRSLQKSAPKLGRGQ